MAIQSLTDLKALINSTIQDNTTNDISGSDVQTALINAIDTLDSLEGFINVHKANGQTTITAYGSKALARAAVPDDCKKEGVVIAYKISTGWLIEQNLDATAGTWGDDASWQTIGPVSVSQNTSTGFADVNVGGVLTPMASQILQDGLLSLTPVAVTKITGKYINVNDSYISSASDDYSVTIPILIRKGEFVIAQLNTGGNYIAAITITDSTPYKIHRVVASGVGNIQSIYSYCAEQDCYITFSGLTSSNISVYKAQTRIFKDIWAKLYNSNILVDGVNVPTYTITQDKYINKVTKSLIDGEGHIATSAIQVLKGQAIIVCCNGLTDNVSIVSLSNSEGGAIEPVVESVGNNLKVYSYTPTSDCYVRLSAYTRNNVFDVIVVNSPIVEVLLTYINQLTANLDALDLISKNKQTPSYTETTGKYVNADTKSILNTSDTNLVVSSPIALTKGQTIQVTVNTLYDFLAAISTCDSSSANIEPVAVGVGNQLKTYTYLATNDCYVILSYYASYEHSVYVSDCLLASDLIDYTNTKLGDFSNKVLGVGGDSITAGNQWSYYVCQALGLTQFNVAVGGARWSYTPVRNVEDTDFIYPQHYTDPDFAGFGASTATDEDRQKMANNNACVHVEKYLAEYTAGNYDAPDIFIFAYGTNYDLMGTEESIDTAMSFTGDIDGADYTENIKPEMCGAIRWCVEKIKTTFPSCKVFISLPIQRADYSYNKNTLIPKIALIKRMAEEMGCQIINQYQGCGITSAIEADSSPFGPYLVDGLHPNTAGQKLMGAFATSVLKAKYFEVD